MSKSNVILISDNLRIPWSVAVLPDGQLILTERPGTLSVIGRNGQRYILAEFQDVAHIGEGGLLGIAIQEPTTTTSGNWLYVYLFYTFHGKPTVMGGVHSESDEPCNILRKEGRTEYRGWETEVSKDLCLPPSGLSNRVVRLRLIRTSILHNSDHDDSFSQWQLWPPRPKTMAEAKAEIIVDNIPAAENHNGGRIAFGPDGYLYIGTGDAKHPHLAQNLDSFAGKILRVRDDGTFPTNNPFFSQNETVERQRQRGAVYSYGHRNVQGLAWSSDANLWATEHGAIAHDKLQHILAGGNYGWPLVEGTVSHAHELLSISPKDAAALLRSSIMPPVVDSGMETWAPCGMAFYNGSLFFAGLRGESLYEIDMKDNNMVHRWLEGKLGRLRDVVATTDGLLVLTSNRDGRGIMQPGDDMLIHVSFA
jgi:glucose/arabinose dehydrogenase